MIENKRILVTGGAGFIGSNVANYLANDLERDNEVIVVDDGYLGDFDNVSYEADIWRGSVLEYDFPTDVDLVIHLAALSSYQMHEDDPVRGALVNTVGFVNTVDRARKQGCTDVVYASTSSIYGSQTDPSPETMDVQARTAYEASKLSREQYAAYFRNHHGMNVAGLRFFSVYQGYNGAEDHKGDYANVIAQFADDIAMGERPVIYGDGEQTRDFIHVDDVVRAVERVADHRLNGVFNVGTGKAHSFNYVVRRINEEMGTTVLPRYVENPIPEDVYVHDTCADASKLMSTTGWVPKVDLDEGIKRVCDQYTR